MPLEPALGELACGARRLANASERDPVKAGQAPTGNDTTAGQLDNRAHGGAVAASPRARAGGRWLGCFRATGGFRLARPRPSSRRGGERASTEGGPALDPGKPGGPGSGGRGPGGFVIGPSVGGTSDKAAGQLAGSFLAAAAGGPGPDSQPRVPEQSIMVSAGNAEDVGTGQSSGAMAGAFTAGAGGVDPVGSASGSTLGTANSEDVGGGKRAGGFVAAAEGAGPRGVQPGRSGLADDREVGQRRGHQCGEQAPDPADQPYAGGGPELGGPVPVPGQKATGSGAGGPDSVLQLPNLEPAADSVAGSPSARSATPPSGGGQLTQGGGPVAWHRTRVVTGNPAQNTAQGRPMSGGSSATASQKGSRGGGQAQGFDWNEAAKEGSPASAASASDAEAVMGASPEGDPASTQAPAASAENLGPGRAILQGSQPVTGQPALPAGRLTSQGSFRRTMPIRLAA